MERMIRINKLYPHPDNPRKDIGDISELTESIKKNGLMQNLTVMPEDCLTLEPEDQPQGASRYQSYRFVVLIGHRRMAAAKEADLVEVPCKVITNISKSEQIGIMLEENMQRSDLTVLEQAQGFQMMLDLGETVETIAEKTGFSKTTVRHRVNIAKLDQNVIKEKESSGFQLSIKDLILLEGIKDIEKRNKILESSGDSRELAWKASNEIKKERRSEKVTVLSVMAKGKGIKLAPMGTEKELWGDKWEIIKEYDLYNDEAPKRMNVKEEDGQLFWVVHFDKFKIIRKRKKKEKELTEEEKKRKEKDSRRKQIGEKLKEMNRQRRDFILNVIEKNIRAEKEQEVKDAIWNWMRKAGTSIYNSDFIIFFTGKREYDCSAEEIAEAYKKIEALPVIYQMLITMNNKMKYLGDVADYQCVYNENPGSRLIEGYENLGKFGWSFEDIEDFKLLQGDSDLYTKEENKWDL